MLEKKKVVYLFGAGATHAEMFDQEKDNSDTFFEKHSILMTPLSKRVLEKVVTDRRLIKKIPFIRNSRKEGNIELLISLVESNSIPESEVVTSELRKIVEKEISKKIQYFSKRHPFYLYKALLELHRKIEGKEQLTGLITLNYDCLLDSAHSDIFKQRPNYCITSDYSQKGIPLLKLHGSFNWYGIPIIPMGVKKNYLAPYYSFVWGRTLELLSQCDLLRVIGCSLNQSDWGLLDLLFKAHLCSEKSFEMQIIDSEPVGNDIQARYGFLPLIKTSHELEDGLLASYQISEDTNIFKLWLREKIHRNLNATQINTSKYIRHVMM